MSFGLLTRLIGNMVENIRFFGNFVLIYLLDMGMTGNIEKSDIFGMNNFIAYQMETFFFVFLVMPSKKCSSVGRKLSPF